MRDGEKNEQKAKAWKFIQGFRSTKIIWENGEITALWRSSFPGSTLECLFRG